MINKPIMDRNDIVVIDADEALINVSLRHEPDMQRIFVVHIAPPCF